MKNYKKFYEIDNNRYYTITADDELYLGTESFLKIGKKKLFRKQKTLTTGFKLLKMSAPISILFNALDSVEPSSIQPYDGDDMIVYDKIDNSKLKEDIKKAYTQVIDDEIKSLEQQGTELIEDGKIDLAKSLQKYIEDLKKVNPLKGIDLEEPKHTASLIIKYMLKSNLEHLYTEDVTAFAKDVYLYEQDCFGTLTIYRVKTIKNVVKTIDTFIYDKELIGNLLKTIYEEGR